MRRVSMATRDELVAAVSGRYRASSRAEKSRIVDEFAASTGYHRKHAMRVLRAGPTSKRSVPRPSRRIYGEAEREALTVLWEAAESDRTCADRGDGAPWASGTCARSARGTAEDECRYHRPGAASATRAMQPATP